MLKTLSKLTLVTVLGWSSVSAQVPINLDPMPGVYSEPGLSPNRDYINQQTQEAVDPFTGKLQLHHVDLSLPGNGGMDIKIQRSYTNVEGFLRDPSPFGIGWTMGFGRILRSGQYCDLNQLAVANNPVLELPDGSRQVFYITSEAGNPVRFYMSLNRWKAECSLSGTGGLVVYSPDGMRYDMTYPGQLISNGAKSLRTYYPTLITDRNGNTLTLTNQPVGITDAVTQVTSSDGRQVNFTYQDGVLKSISDGHGSTVNYVTKPVPNTYPGYFYLTAVERPDNSSWKYDYNESMNGSAGAGSIKKLTYPGGGSLNYEYDNTIQFGFNISPLSTHVVKRKTDDAGHAWTYSYYPSQRAYDPAEDGSFSNNCFDPMEEDYDDRTVVDGPDSVITYCHTGYNSVGGIDNGNGFGYLLGALSQKRVLDKTSNRYVESMAYSHTYDLISSLQAMIRSGDKQVMHTVVYAVLPESVYASRYGEAVSVDYSNFDAYGNPQIITESGTNTRAGGLQDERVTTVGYKINTSKWLIRQKQNESVVVNGESMGSILRDIDGSGNVIKETKFTVPTEWTYTSQGEISTKKDALGYVATFENYKCGIPQLEKKPVDAFTVASATEVISTIRVVDDACNITSVTDGENANTVYTYDGLHRLKTITHPQGNSVSVQWTPTSRTVTRGNFREVTGFDAYGRVNKHEAIDLATQKTMVTNFVNDVAGHQVFKSFPNSTYGTVTLYDVLDEPIQEGQGCTADLQCNSWRYLTWTANKHSVKDENSHETIYTYRWFSDPAERQLMAVQSPDNLANSTLTRNGMGQVTQVLQGGLTRAYEYYPGTYFLYKATDPETGVTVYGRDAVGNMKTKTVGASATTSYQYDGVNRLKEITYPAGTPTVTRGYYKDDKIKFIQNSAARREYFYDSNKNKYKETLVIGNQPPFDVNYEYDDNDALKLMTYGASGQTVNFNPDGFGRAGSALPFVKNLVYHEPSGEIKSMVFANGVTNTLEVYENKLWPKVISHNSSNKAILAENYTYDNVGNLRTMWDSVSATNRVMSYDKIDRLETFSENSGNTQSSIGINYDSAGNIRQQNADSGSMVYAYDTATNRLTGVSGSKNINFAYDAYGNVNNRAGVSYTYNDASNMTCALCGQAGRVDYQYDGLGLRVSQTGGGVSTYFFHEGNGRLLSEKTGGTTKDYIYLAGKQVAVHELTPSSGGGTQTGGVTNLSIAMVPSTNTPQVGKPVTYTVTVTNSGSQDASNVQVIDAIPSGMTFVSASAGCVYANNVVTCQAASVAAASSVAFQIVLTPTRAANVSNAVSVASSTANSAPATGTLALVTIKAGIAPGVIAAVLSILQN